MVKNEIETVLGLAETLNARVIGQRHALEMIAMRIQTARAKLDNPNKPVGVFLLCGPSGVGKTETALTLAEALYGGEQNVITINMSEFQEAHTVSTLKGSPPGYVGYGEGGVLTEAVRRKPYSVVLLDEMEKAHSGVQDIFYQVFDKGTMKDGEGRDIDFKNTIILMTTNAGGNVIRRMYERGEQPRSAEELNEALFDELLKTFKPAFLGRLAVVPYLPLADATMRRIVELKLGKIATRIRDSYGAGFDYTPQLVDAIVGRCTEVATGARNVDHILTRTLLPELSAEFLARMCDNLPIDRVEVSLGEDGGFLYQVA
jgi:type VI secretion system protein VasG